RRGGLQDLVRSSRLGEFPPKSAVLLLERLSRASRRGGAVTVAPDPQGLRADPELRGDCTDRCCAGTTLADLAVVDHAHGAVTQLGTELLGRAPILLAETRDGTQDASVFRA